MPKRRKSRRFTGMRNWVGRSRPDLLAATDDSENSTERVKKKKVSSLSTTWASYSQCLHEILEEIRWMWRKPVARIWRPTFNLVLEWQREHKCHPSECRFWTSRIACFMYANTALALACREARILYGVMLALLLQILWVVLQWVVYTVDDPQMWANIAWISSWLQLFARESEAIFNGESTRLLMAGAVPFTAPTGLGYFRAILRYKMSVVNNLQVKELSSKRAVYDRIADHKAAILQMSESARSNATRARKQIKQAVVSYRNQLSNFSERSGVSA